MCEVADLPHNWKWGLVNWAAWSMVQELGRGWAKLATLSCKLDSLLNEALKSAVHRVWE